MFDYIWWTFRLVCVLEPGSMQCFRTPKFVHFSEIRSMTVFPSDTIICKISGPENSFIFFSVDKNRTRPICFGIVFGNVQIKTKFFTIYRHSWISIWIFTWLIFLFGLFDFGPFWCPFLSHWGFRSNCKYGFLIFAYRTAPFLLLRCQMTRLLPRTY